MDREREVWKGNNRKTCVWLCMQFREHGLASRVVQHGETFGRQSEKSYLILVPEKDFDKARDAVAKYEERTNTRSEQLSDGLEPLVEAPVWKEDVVSMEERERSAQVALDEADMTAEVWSGQAEDGLWMIKMSLKELEIGCRAHTATDGKVSVFVALRDERAAQDVVREVRDGSRPE
jgi:hypothetical protein